MNRIILWGLGPIWRWFNECSWQDVGSILLMPHLIVVKMLCVIWIGEEDFAEKKEKGIIRTFFGRSLTAKLFSLKIHSLFNVVICLMWWTRRRSWCKAQFSFSGVSCCVRRRVVLLFCCYWCNCMDCSSTGINFLYTSMCVYVCSRMIRVYCVCSGV